MTAKRKREDMGPGRELDIEQDDRFQHREWRVEKFGTVLLVLFLLAGLLGFLGRRPFSHATVHSEAGGLQLEYRRITHYMADDNLTFTVSEEAVENGTVTLELTGSWVSGVDVSSISPQPSTQYAIPGGMALEFDVLRPGNLEIDLSTRATQYLMLNADASVGEESVSFSQFILP